jgi:hypothetical protein
MAAAEVDTAACCEFVDTQTCGAGGVVCCLARRPLAVFRRQDLSAQRDVAAIWSLEVLQLLHLTIGRCLARV